MKKSIYSVYDSVAQVYGHTVSEINDGSAVRAFVQSFQENPNVRDYTLYKLADYTDHDGEVMPCDVPIKIYSGFDIVKDSE